MSMRNLFPRRPRFALEDFPPLPHVDDMAPDAARLLHEHEREVTLLLDVVVQGQCQLIAPALARVSAQAHPVNWLSARFVPEYMMLAGGIVSAAFALMGFGLNISSLTSIALGICGAFFLYWSVRRYRKYGVVDSYLVSDNKLILAMGNTLAHMSVCLNDTGTEDAEATHEVRSELVVSMAEAINAVHGQAVLLQAAQTHFGVTVSAPAGGR